ncbi:MAG TPA: ClpX C4-type zinc finger protein [Roseiarcus sp.]|nr:ClpX C4-type zinc finger protein [Roseiarcus sp.]
MTQIECSFCGVSATKDDARDKYIAGPNVFICRDCVDTMIEIFCETDPEWGRRTMKRLAERAKGE